jgi:membrane-associated phospholipid phosphatase
LKYGDELLDLKGPTITLARITSRLLPAPLVNLYVGIILSLWSPVGLGPTLRPLESILICIVAMVVLPIVPILYSAWRGHVDLDVSERESRPKFFLFSLLCYALAYIVYWYLGSLAMMTLAAAYFLVTAAVMTASFKTKVSVHAAGVGGPGTVIILMFGPVALVFTLLWVAVVWSRTALRQHTLAQSIAGLAIGILVAAVATVLVYAP